MKNLKELGTVITGTCLRGAERVLPPTCLYLLLWPSALLLTAYELVYAGPTFRRFRKMPLSFRPSVDGWRWAVQLWSGRISLNATKFLRFWPDRLGERKWQSRFDVKGEEVFNRALASERPIILAMLHFGPMTELYHWLRARGHQVVGLVGDELDRIKGYHGRLNKISDHINGLSGTPRFFGVHQLWELRDFLSAPRRILLVPIDGKAGKRSLSIDRSDFQLDFRVGTFALADITQAIIVPTAIVARAGLRSEIQFSSPLPNLDFSDRTKHKALCEHVAIELLPLIQANPEQCASQLFIAMRQVLKEPVDANK